jgi:hypothetical protein
VWQQAANRMHAARGALALLLGATGSGTDSGAGRPGGR